MKKILVLLAAVVLTVTTQASANPIIENEVVTAAFQKQFAEATDVSWSQKHDLYLVSFKYNNDRMLAWYRPDGVVEAVQRLPRDFPILLQLCHDLLWSLVGSLEVLEHLCKHGALPCTFCGSVRERLSEFFDPGI